MSWTPGFSVSDPDGGASWSFSMMNGNNSERFSVGPTSGVMTFAMDYDIDNSAMPSSTIVTVQCIDNTGKTGTAKITLNIQV